MSMLTSRRNSFEDYVAGGTPLDMIGRVTVDRATARLARRDDPAQADGYGTIRGLSAADDRRYVGERGSAGCRVVVVDGAEELQLRPRTSDPLSSFSWGRSGASARELAWSILYDSARDCRLADDWCSAFCIEVVSHLPHDAFCIGSREVLAWLFEKEGARR